MQPEQRDGVSARMAIVMIVMAVVVLSGLGLLLAFGDGLGSPLEPTSASSTVVE